MFGASRNCSLIRLSCPHQRDGKGIIKSMMGRQSSKLDYTTVLYDSSHALEGRGVSPICFLRGDLLHSPAPSEQSKRECIRV